MRNTITIFILIFILKDIVFAYAYNKLDRQKFYHKISKRKIFSKFELINGMNDTISKSKEQNKFTTNHDIVPELYKAFSKYYRKRKFRRCKNSLDKLKWKIRRENNNSTDKCSCNCPYCSCKKIKNLKLNQIYHRIRKSTNSAICKNEKMKKIIKKKKKKKKHKHKKLEKSEKLRLEKLRMTPKEQQFYNCKNFLNNIDGKLIKLYHSNTIVQWNYETNITETTKKLSIAAETNLANKLKDIAVETLKFDKKYKCHQVVSREFLILLKLGDAALSTTDYHQLQTTLRNMETIYSTATIPSICDDSKRIYHLEPDITNIMATNRNSNVLSYVWDAWHNTTGNKSKIYYPKFVELTNKAAKLNGYQDAADMWLDDYDDKRIEIKILQLWKTVEPLYIQLHAYVRWKLAKFYDKIVENDQPIPAYLLGNIFGQSWLNIYNITCPYPKDHLPDITEKLKQSNYTVDKMLKTAESFFTSLTFEPMTKKFWNNSVFHMKHYCEMVCHASAWDMFSRNDFRIKMCAQVTYEDFVTIHHEMGHIVYYMQYKNLPVTFRDGANQGFHEAVGDVIALSVTTPQHLKLLGLYDQANYNTNADINYLYLMALQKIVFLPYALIVDMWRWDVFREKIKPPDYNKHWWDLRKKYQGIKPPKFYKDNFDPGGKYHITAGVPYIRYFISFIIQFQFHAALCKEAGQFNNTTSTLHNCDIYKSHKAGVLFKHILSLGQQKPWQDIMYDFTKSRDISASSLLTYFHPLEKWLKEHNTKNNVTIGWKLS